MSVALSYSLTGERELLAALERLENKQLNAIIRRGLRDGAKVLQAAEKVQAPVGGADAPYPGLLRRAIKVRSGRLRRKDRVAINVVLSSKEFPPGKYYGFAVHYGHKAGRMALGDKRKHVPANRFADRAFELTKTQALETILASVSRQLVDLAAGDET